MKPKSSRTSTGAETGKGPRILCGTDFTDNAQQAARVAAAIAKRLDEPVLLVHALDFPGYAAKGKSAGLFRLIKANRRKLLQQEAESVRKDVVVGYVDWPLERQTRLRGAGSLPLVGSPTDLQVILERNLKTVVAEVLARLSGFEAIRSGSH